MSKPPTNRLRIAAVQMSMSEQPEENLGKAQSMVREAMRQGAALVCLPELFQHRYFCQTEDPRYYEKFYFTPGDLGFKSFDTSAGAVGVLVCWDQWYPEAARLTALGGAAVLLYPTAIGWHPEERAALGERQHSAWETIQRSHAIANGCFVMAANRTGFEPDPGGSGGIRFWGQSFIAGTDGRILARAGVDDETVVLADLDMSEIAQSRIGWPFLRDRRIDAYDAIRLRFSDQEQK